MVAGVPMGLPRLKFPGWKMVASAIATNRENASRSTRRQSEIPYDTQVYNHDMRDP